MGYFILFFLLENSFAMDLQNHYSKNQELLDNNTKNQTQITDAQHPIIAWEGPRPHHLPHNSYHHYSPLHPPIPQHHHLPHYSPPPLPHQHHHHSHSHYLSHSHLHENIEFGCKDFNVWEDCVSHSDMRVGHTFSRSPCQWCCGDKCTTQSNNLCESREWLLRQPNYVGYSENGLGENTCHLQALSNRNEGCNLIRDKKMCLSSKDGRRGLNISDSPCQWCCDGHCSIGGNNVCEPRHWLLRHPHYTGYSDNGLDYGNNCHVKGHWKEAPGYCKLHGHVGQCKTNYPDPYSLHHCRHLAHSTPGVIAFTWDTLHGVQGHCVIYFDRYKTTCPTLEGVHWYQMLDLGASGKIIGTEGTTGTCGWNPSSY